MEEEHKNAKKQKHKMSYYKYSEANSAKIKLMPETWGKICFSIFVRIDSLYRCLSGDAA